MPKEDIIDAETGEVLEEAFTPIRVRRPFERVRLMKDFFNKSRTQAHFADECDINQVMAKYQKFGVIDAVQKTNGIFGDFTGVGDYHTAMNAIVDAQDRFARLPSSVRKRFHNDPAELLEFLSDEENRDEAVKLGLIVPEQKDKAGADQAPSPTGGPEPSPAKPPAPAPASEQESPSAGS